MKFDPMQIFFFLLRIIPVILVIVLIAYAFFSFKVELETKEMERLNVELAENILVSDMVVEKSIFNTKKLIKIENDPNAQPKPQVCGYGYYLSIDGLEEKYCEKGDDCKYFCMNACGLSENEIEYKCEKGIFGLRKLFGGYECQCKCPNKNNNDWFDKYSFYFGYKAGDTKIDDVDINYPVGIYEEGVRGLHQSTVSPAKMTLTIYDSWLTRMACMAEKAYDLKEIQRMVVYDFSNFGFVKDCFVSAEYKCISARKFDEKLCIFGQKDMQTVLGEKECVYSDIPVITFFTVYRYKGFNNATLIAYPIKKNALDSFKKEPLDFFPRHICLNYDSAINCIRIKYHPEYVATKNDEVGTVIFCLETYENGKYVPSPGQLDCV
jgi:hypothetical protein